MVSFECQSISSYQYRGFETTPSRGRYHTSSKWILRIETFARRPEIRGLQNHVEKGQNCRNRPYQRFGPMFQKLKTVAASSDAAYAPLYTHSQAKEA